MRLDFLGVGFNRSGSAWLRNCLSEHPEISMPKLCMLTEANYFPEEYELTGMKNYMKIFKNCDFEKVVGELSVMTIFKKRSAKLLKRLFPHTKIVIYKRKEEDRVASRRRRLESLDLLDNNSEILKNEDFIDVNPVNQEELIKPFKEEFGRNLFIFDMDKKGKEQLKELYRFYDFLGIKKIKPKCFDTRPNSSFDFKCKYPILRKIINFFKYRLRKNKKLFYQIKRMFNIDYYFQWINRRI